MSVLSHANSSYFLLCAYGPLEAINETILTISVEKEKYDQ